MNHSLYEGRTGKEGGKGGKIRGRKEREDGWQEEERRKIWKNREGGKSGKLWEEGDKGWSVR